VIRVSFVLLDNGQIKDLEVKDGHGVLRQAALEAVKSALPMPTPPPKVNCPLQVNYGMEFRLR
jgi:TonB family protein